MQQYSMLVLTDHSGHSAENSLYTLARMMRSHPRCRQLDVATKANPFNDGFFLEMKDQPLLVNEVDEHFRYHPEGNAFRENAKREWLKNYDVIWLRMPPPLPVDFLDFLISEFSGRLFINDPAGIKKTGSKEFLLEFPDLCPPMKLCTSLQDIRDFKDRFAIVLKPLREYGGKGIVKIDGDRVWEENRETTFSEFAARIEKGPVEYLGVEFLKNVTQGDKRIIVVNGRIMGASLRLPPPDSWICNVAMGGDAQSARADADEKEIVRRIDPALSAMGIVMYGIDTLVNDDGRRVLSEINATSIGGLPQIAEQQKEPLVEMAAELIWDYIIRKKLAEDAVSNR